MPLTSLLDFSKQKNQIGEYLNDNLNYLSKDKDQEIVLDILYIGVYFTDQVLYPYLEELFKENKNITVNVTILVNDITVNEINEDRKRELAIKIDEIIFKKNSNRNSYTYKPNKNIFDFSSKKKILNTNIGLNKDGLQDEEIKKIQFNFNSIDSLSKKVEDKKYDIIFCLFELHRSINWRIGMMSLLSILKPNGSLIFSEINGSIELLDGNFKNSDKYEKGILNNDPDLKENETFAIQELIQYLKKFDHERQNKHFWRPEISSTNYKVLANQIGYFFNSVIGYTQDSNSFESVFWQPNIVKSKEDVHEIIDNKETSYFKLGLSESDQFVLNLKKNIEESKYGFRTGGALFTLDAGLKFYVASKLREDIEPKSFNTHYWNFNSLFNNLHELYCEELSEFGNKALDVFLTHGMVLPEYTKLVTIVSFLETEVKDLARPIYTCINLNSFDDDQLSDKNHILLRTKNNLDYFMANDENDENIVLRTIFKTQKYKSNIRIKRVENFDNMAIVKYEQIYNDGNYIIYYNFTKNRNDRVTEIELIFNYKYDNDDEKSITDNYTPSPKFDEIYDNLYKVSTNESKNIKSSNNAYIHILKAESLKNIDLLNSILGIADAFKFIEIFHSIITCFFNDKKSINHTLNFYPSTIAVKGSGGQKEYEGLGGCILFGKSNYKTDLDSFILARDRAISEASNILLYKASVISRKDFRRNSRKAAIAAITSRNISHNIGSHVIPNVKNYNSSALGTILNNEMKGKHKSLFHDRIKSVKFFEDVNQHLNNYKHSYDDFLNYLQQRTDFVNQLTSGYGRWDISAWFVREVMAKFYKQKLLMDNIGYSEGLTSYDYSLNNKVIHGKVNFINGKFKVNNFYILAPSTINNILNTYIIEEKELINIFELNKNKSFKFTGEIINEEIENGNFLDGKIIIQLRRRKYKVLNSDTGKWYLNITSTKLEESNTFDLHKYRNISDLLNKIGTQYEKIYLYAVVRISKMNNLYVLSNNWEIKTLNKHKKLVIGTRVIFEVEVKQLYNKREEININLNVTLVEYSYTVYVISTDTKVHDNNLINNDIRVSISGGIAGYQAFYTVLENIIRNAIKHNWAELTLKDRIGKNLEVKIEYSDSSKDRCFYLKIWTNLDSDSIRKNLSKKINRIFQEDIIDNDGNFFKKVLGSVEMKINAAYIADVNANLTDSNYIKGPNVILDDKEKHTSKGYIRSSNIFEKEGSNLVEKLGFRLKISKPDDITLFYKNTLNTNSSFIKTLIKTQCNIIDNNKYPIISNSDLFVLYDDTKRYFIDTIIIDPKSMVHDIERLDFVKYFFYFKEHDVENEIKKLFVETLINIVDKLPFRILYISQIEIYKTLLSISKHPSLFNSIRHRIVFCREDFFIGKNDPIDLHYELRLTWLKIHFEYISINSKMTESIKDKISIPKQYTLSVNIIKDADYYPSSMPLSFIENSNVKIHDEDVFNKNSSIENLNVRYVRHDSLIEPNDVSLTHLSGKMPSYCIFRSN